MPSSIQPPRRLSALVSWQTGKVATLGARLTARLMPLGARTDFAILAALDQYGPLSQADLGRRLGLDRNDVSTVLTRLMNAQQVTRQPDAADPRRNQVTATKAGLLYLEQLQRHADLVQRDLLTGLDDTESAQLTALLDRVLAHHPTQSA